MSVIQHIFVSYTDARISKKVSQSAALDVIKTHKNFVGNNQVNETGDIQKAATATSATASNSCSSSSSSCSSSIEKPPKQLSKVNNFFVFIYCLFIYKYLLNSKLLIHI